MKIACEDCGSSDGCEVYDDGARTHCFVCNTTKFPKEEVNVRDIPSNNSVHRATRLDEINGYRSYPMSSRGISQEVVDHFDVKMSVDSNGRPGFSLLSCHQEGYYHRL